MNPSRSPIRRLIARDYGSLGRYRVRAVVDKEGTQARLDMEKLFDSKVYLEVWIKVKSGWADSERAVKSLGYE